MLTKTSALLIFPIILCFITCAQKADVVTTGNTLLEYRAPRVLILTSGDNDGTGTVSKGVSVTLESLNRLGARVFLDNRSVLYRPGELVRYTHIYAPTLYGYNDADRNFSLTYLDSIALNNIVDWVAAGGVLVAAENFGRNDNDGIDRIASYRTLTPDNWPPAKLFECNFDESNFDSSYFEMDTNNIIAQAWPNDRTIFNVNRPGWLLTPVLSNLDRKYKIWANWNNHGLTRPAAISNQYYKGYAIYLSLSLILHPVTDGGLSTKQEIYQFWRKIISLPLNETNAPMIGVNPWPGEYQSAVAITLNSSGNEKSLHAILDSLTSNGGHVTVFLHGQVPEKSISSLSNKPGIEIASGGFNIDVYPEAGFESIREDFYKAKQAYGNNVRGFRFPRLRRSYDAILLLENQNYLYESSITTGADANGSGNFIPYNIPIYKQSEELYATNVLELSPIEHDDWFFFGNGITSGNYSDADQIKDAELYGEYLKQVLDENIIPINGLMVQIGYPDYVGYSQNTSKPLIDFVKNINTSGNIWLANLAEIAEFWQKRNNFDFDIVWDGQTAYCSIPYNSSLNQEKISLKIIAPDGLMLSKVSGKDKTDYQFITSPDGSYLVRISSQEIQLKFIK